MSKPKTNKKSLKKNLKGLNIGFIVVALTVMLAIGYLVQVNSLSTKGYEIRQLELQVRELKEVSKKLELEASSLQSIQSIEEDVQTLNLIPSGTVKHLKEQDYAFRD